MIKNPDKSSILSDFQKTALILLKKSGLNLQFYLAGGTALAEYYLKHRKSEYLDFFSENELSLFSLKKYSALISSKIPMDKMEFQHGFGLYTFFYYPKGEVAKYKIDFGQYPFGTIEKTKEINGIMIESLFDLAVDKAHTISVRPRFRDFIDLYLILQEKKDWTFKDLLKKGQEKFEIFVDPLQLGENLLQVKNISDMPIMLNDLDMKAVRKFFLNEARSLRKKIIE